MNIDVWGEYFPELLRGLVTALQVTAASLGIGLPLGLVLAVGLMSNRRGIWLSALVVVELGRSLPTLLVLQVLYFGLPGAGLTLTSFICTVAALGFATAAFSSEYIRGGLHSVPFGQSEAAQALNLTGRDALRFVIVPQGLRVAVPALLGFSIVIFQATSLAFTVALPEIMAAANNAASSSFQYLSLFTLAGLVYAAVAIPASRVTGLVERRLSRHLHPSQSP